MSHPCFRWSASQNSLLLRKKPCSLIRTVVSHEEASFFFASEINLLWGSGQLSIKFVSLTNFSQAICIPDLLPGIID